MQTFNHLFSMIKQILGTFCRKTQNSDGTFSPTKEYIIENDRENEINGFVVTGLKPSSNNKDYMTNSIRYRVYLNEEYLDYGVKVNTKPLNLSPNIETTPTAFIIKPTHDKGDADVKGYKFCLFEGSVKNPFYEMDLEPGKSCVVTGLTPTRTYSYRLYAEIASSTDVYTHDYYEYDKSSNKYTFKPYVSTSSLTFNILPPRNVSATSSIVSAETNISDWETNVGFQWRKYDAPSSLPSNEGFASIYGDRMEGRINNLQSSFYYDVRAFYKDSSETYYYSEWITFDPSDFSYFDPTVHTYEANNVGATEVSLRGYVMQGTDDIESQGFEYYVVDNPSNVYSVRAMTPEEPMVALATGQSMSVVLRDLLPATTYSCRAFAITSTNKIYGEEITFTTSELSGIDNVAPSMEKEVVGYYSISGVRYNVPQQGLNIVVYSDGSVEKIITR